MSSVLAFLPSKRVSVALPLLLGLFLTFRGYRSLDGDQAYRLPILLHRQDPSILKNDPFVAYFAAFNPHQGSLFLQDWLSRPLGLSACLLGLFLVTFFVTGFGIDRLTRTAWPDLTGSVGIVAAGLVYFAQAGNVGTNHLFEPLLLDRLMAFGLGWVAIGSMIRQPSAGLLDAAIALGVTSFVHPSLGLQLALLLMSSWLVAAGFSRWTLIPWKTALAGLSLLGIAVTPGYLFNVGSSKTLFEGLSSDDFRMLCSELQSPQHMVPHLWRMPQWLGFACYPLLAMSSLLPTSDQAAHTAFPVRRTRLLIVLGVNLLGLAVAWAGVEVLGSLTLTIFQPFRLATFARGLCLVFVSGHLVRLWEQGLPLTRARAALIAVGFLGDWSLVLATAFEIVMVVHDRFGATFSMRVPGAGRLISWIALGVFAWGLLFLARHDTESGHLVSLPVALGTLVFGERIARRFKEWGTWRVGSRLAMVWVVPIAAIAANVTPEDALRDPRFQSVRLSLIRRCRFAKRPVDDLERLGLWAREQTPKTAAFIGPPGQKSFRLWSERAVAFNRAGSPYHANGLKDWAERFRDHVAFEGSNAELVAAYLKDRHGLERRYDALEPDALADLAARQGATYVIGRSSLAQRLHEESPLVLIRTEGRFAIYQVRGEPNSTTKFVQVPIKTRPGKPPRGRDSPD